MSDKEEFSDDFFHSIGENSLSISVVVFLVIASESNMRLLCVSINFDVDFPESSIACDVCFSKVRGWVGIRVLFLLSVFQRAVLYAVSKIHSESGFFLYHSKSNQNCPLFLGIDVLTACLYS